MARNGARPNPVARVDLADVFSPAALDTREDSANRPARQVRTSEMSIPSLDGGGRAHRPAAETALAAVLAARSLRAAHLAARDGLDRLAEAAPCDVLEVDEAAELAKRTRSTVRRWAAAHRLGRRLGGRWLLSRARFSAFIGGGAA